MKYSFRTKPNQYGHLDIGMFSGKKFETGEYEVQVHDVSEMAEDPAAQVGPLKAELAEALAERKRMAQNAVDAQLGWDSCHADLEAAVERISQLEGVISGQKEQVEYLRGLIPPKPAAAPDQAPAEPAPAAPVPEGESAPATEEAPQAE